jgi:hypothetical protein
VLRTSSRRPRLRGASAESLLRVYWVAVPQALRAPRVNRSGQPEHLLALRAELGGMKTSALRKSAATVGCVNWGDVTASRWSPIRPPCARGHPCLTTCPCALCR